jgi:oligopeptide/dipeptide ABC transporter ATP-binding protein
MTLNELGPVVMEARHLRKTFQGHGGAAVHAVDDVSLTLRAGETVGLIGESGSGKSTLGRLLLGLLPADHGGVMFQGIDVVGALPKDMRRLRTQMQVVFQEPYESLNPRMRVASLIAEPLVVQGDLPKAERDLRVEEALAQVGLKPELARRFPGELSGGQQQRVGIARAIVGRPRLVVLDEPTASLDRTIRRQITDLLLKIQADLDLAFLLITHDIGSGRRMASRSVVMYRGHLVESGPTNDILDNPAHPYTKALVSAELPAKLNAAPTRYRLKQRPANGRDLPTGCPLRTICPLAIEECETELPPMLSVWPNHESRCIRWADVAHSSPDSRPRSEDTSLPTAKDAIR